MRLTTYLRLMTLATAVSLASGAPKITRLISRGTGHLSMAKSATAETGFETRQNPATDAQFIRGVNGKISPARLPADGLPTPAASPIVPGLGFSGFAGISHLQQRLAGGGNQFSLEPPDQALAVGNGFVLESVNLAIAAYTPTGTLLAIDSLNDFFGLAPAILRTVSPPVFGPFTSDPRAYYDASTGRWFVTVLEIDTDPATGAFKGGSSVLIAVSQTSSPLGGWNLFAIDTTNAGDPINHPGCPCFGDQPLIGADANGFYVTTNEFSIAGPNFNGAQIYATSKTLLESGTQGAVVSFSGLPLAEGVSFSVQPATTPPGGTFESAKGGTEYFVSSLDFSATLDNRIAVWAMTNTSSLADATPTVAIQSLVISSEVYGQTPAMQQKPGPLPLADLLKTKNNIEGITTNEHLELINANDDRLQQVVFADGSLWTSLNTVVKPPNGPTRVGAAWFIVTPSVAGTTLSATMTKQGYVVADQENLAFPSIGVNKDGKGIMAFTLIGPDFFPSAAFATIDKANGTGDIQISGPGAGPDDGFTGYGAFGGRVARWGDYTTAVADADGSIWTGVEFIPGGARTVLANWGTFLTHVLLP
jgi:hypothetical protein